MEPSAESPFGSRAYQRAARESAGTMVLRTVESGMRDLEGDGSFARRFRAAQEVGRVLDEVIDGDTAIRRICSNRGAPSLVVALMLEADESNAARRMPILKCLANLVRFVPFTELQDQRMWMVLQRMLFHSDTATISLALNAVKAMATVPECLAFMCSASFARRLSQTVRSLVASDDRSVSQTAQEVIRHLDGHSASARQQATVARPLPTLNAGGKVAAPTGGSLGWLPSFARRRAEAAPASGSSSNVRTLHGVTGAPPEPLSTGSNGTNNSAHTSGRASPIEPPLLKHTPQTNSSRSVLSREAQIEELKKWRGLIEVKAKEHSKRPNGSGALQPSNSSGSSADTDRSKPVPSSERRLISDIFIGRTRRRSREMQQADVDSAVEAEKKLVGAKQDTAAEAPTEAETSAGRRGLRVSSSASYDYLPLHSESAGRPPALVETADSSHASFSSESLAVEEGPQVVVSSVGSRLKRSTRSWNSATTEAEALLTAPLLEPETETKSDLPESDLRRRVKELTVEAPLRIEDDARSLDGGSAPSEFSSEGPMTRDQVTIGTHGPFDGNASSHQGALMRGESSDGGYDFELEEAPISPSAWTMSPAEVARLSTPGLRFGSAQLADQSNGGSLLRPRDPSMRTGCASSGCSSSTSPELSLEPSAGPDSQPSHGTLGLGNTVNAADSAEAIANTMALIQQASMQSSTSTAEAQRGMSAAERRRARRNRFADVPSLGDDAESVGENSGRATYLSGVDSLGENSANHSRLSGGAESVGEGSFRNYRFSGAGVAESDSARRSGLIEDGSPEDESRLHGVGFGDPSTLQMEVDRGECEEMMGP